MEIINQQTGTSTSIGFTTALQQALWLISAFNKSQFCLKIYIKYDINYRTYILRLQFNFALGLRKVVHSLIYTINERNITSQCPVHLNLYQITIFQKTESVKVSALFLSLQSQVFLSCSDTNTCDRWMTRCLKHSVLENLVRNFQDGSWKIRSETHDMNLDREVSILLHKI